MARGGTFGAAQAQQLHRRATQRLRGGRCQVSMSGAAATRDKDQRVDLAVPDCVTQGDEMAPQYDPSAVEEPLYKWWEESGFFKPSQYKKGEKKSYVLPMPPPNVTGGLHMGHAMFVALQDILARYHRMKGEPTLWLPGTDHAGIATQLLVERSLNAEGISRYDLGRDKFLEKVWEWKADKGGYITQQLRRLGASADWSRERFTMDDGLSEAVAEAFVQLHDKGLVYRGEYMVNWSPNLRTAVSDLEVEYSDEEGKLYFFRYPLAGGGPDDFLPVATTRPETILGDTAVCVHPQDPRYHKFIGKKVKVPMSEREIPVIADEYVDREFGTGCLKITPGHDPNDYELGKKHELPTINIMNLDASMNDKCGAYEGLGPSLPPRLPPPRPVSPRSPPRGSSWRAACPAPPGASQRHTSLVRRCLWRHAYRHALWPQCGPRQRETNTETGTGTGTGTRREGGTEGGREGVRQGGREREDDDRCG